MPYRWRNRSPRISASLATPPPAPSSQLMDHRSTLTRMTACFMGLVNIGVFRIQPRQREGTERDNLLKSCSMGMRCTHQAGLASEDLIALLRDVRGTRDPGELAEREAAPVITLTDGPLGALPRAAHRKSISRPIQDNYLAALDDLAVKNVITAGYVSRPRADLVVNLLALLTLKPTPIPRVKPFAGITDITLSGRPPGCRRTLSHFPSAVQLQQGLRWSAKRCISSI